MDFILLIPSTLLLFGILGICFARTNLILILICIELLSLAIALHFIFIGWSSFGDFKILWLCISLLSVGAAESSMGLALLIAYHKTSWNY